MGLLPPVIAVDTNVLVYAHRAESPLHGVARERLKSLAEGATPWRCAVRSRTMRFSSPSAENTGWTPPDNDRDFRRFSGIRVEPLAG